MGQLRRLGVAAVGLSLLAAACGGSDEDAGGETDSSVTTVAAASTTAAASAGTTTTAAPVKTPTSMAEWQALWKTQREAVVKKIKDAKVGKSADGKTATGTGGFTINLTKCPTGWSDTEGVTDTEIKIGHNAVYSGTLADYGNISRAIVVQGDALNKAGGITDWKGKTRKVTYMIKDDGYDATRAVPLIDELVESDKVFWMISLGSPTTMKVYDKLNQRCVPNALALTGHPAWGDPVNHPWTTGLQLAYNTEAVLWGAFIEKNIDQLGPSGGKAVIAGLIMNNDFGKSYESGFKAFLAESKFKDRITFVSETIEPTAPTITDAMTTLASKKPSMFIAMTAGTSCTQSIQEAAQNGMKEKVAYLFMPSVCAGKSFIGQDKVGMSGDGWWILSGGIKDLSDKAFDNDPFIKNGRDELAAAGFDYKSSGSFGSGYLYGWAQLQLLQIAAQLDGGLTRTNLMIAVRAMDMTHPYLLEGMKFNMNGNLDAYPIEGGVFQKRDAAKETWVSQGGVIELSGKSKNCVWSQTTSNCT